MDRPKSSAVSISLPCFPKSTTSSPGRTNGTPDTSIIHIFIQILPIMGQRVPRTKTLPSPENLRSYPSQYPTGRTAIVRDEEALYVLSYPTVSPFCIFFTCAIHVFQVSAGRSLIRVTLATLGAGYIPYIPIPNRTVLKYVSLYIMDAAVEAVCISRGSIPAA